MSNLRIALASLLALLGLPAGSGAAEVRVPIALDQRLLEHLLESRVFDQPGGVARIWDDGRGCNLLLLRHPRVSMRGDVVRIVADVEAHVGTPVGETCLFSFEWRGSLEVLEEPSLDPGRARVAFRVVDSDLLDADGSKSLVEGALWNWVKAYVPPRFETVTVDLSDTLATLRQLLPLFLVNAPGNVAQGIVDSLGVGELRATGEGLEVSLRLSLPPPPVPPEPTGPGPALTAQQLARLENAAQDLDAFLTFVMRQAGGESSQAELRRELLGVLLEARRDLVDALSSPPSAAEDPVRAIFVRTWERLAPALRRLGNEVPGEGGLRYLSLVTAADALRALDALGPLGGFEISADGLRRLARVVAPASAEDPLAYGFELDPTLRSALGFGPPLPEPEALPEPESGPTPAEPAVPPVVPPSAPSEPNPSPPAPRSGLWPAVRRFIAALPWNPLAVGEAHAAEATKLADTPAGLSHDQLSRLDRWVPSVSELDVYLPQMRNLLRAVAAERMATDSLDARYRSIFSPLVLATAWQETCWRQFVRVAGRVRAIRSRAGAVGLMQINTRVWRGFYSVPSLERHVGYNARAGSEILMRYLVDDVIDDPGIRGGSTDDLAQATYVVYNGGPSALDRWRDHRRSRRAREVDRAFQEKFRAVRAGQDLAVATCFASGT